MFLVQHGARSILFAGASYAEGSFYGVSADVMFTLTPS
jgi:hypothetical protein